MTTRSENSLVNYPTPFYLYHADRLLEDASALEKGLKIHIPKLGLYFSTKTNPLPRLLRDLKHQGWLFEVISPADIESALSIGAPRESLQLAGAAWTFDLLQTALLEAQINHLIIDSVPMAQLLGNFLKQNPSINTLNLSLRIHDGNSHFGMPGEPSALAQAISHIPSNKINKIGLHTHRNPNGSIKDLKELEKDFSERAEKLMNLRNSIHDFKISFFNFGGGIDSPWIYRPAPEELGSFHDPHKCTHLRDKISFPRFSLEEAGIAIGNAVKQKIGANFDGEIFFEPGRSVCSRALSTIIEVLAIKDGFYSGKDVLITNGNTAFLGPIHRAIHPLEALVDAKQRAKVRAFIYGNLPHSGDWLFQNIELPKMQHGEQLMIHHTGAYFLPLEAHFGFPLPGIIDAQTGEILRHPENALKPESRDIP